MFSQAVANLAAYGTLSRRLLLQAGTQRRQKATMLKKKHYCSTVHTETTKYRDTTGRV